MNVKFWRGKRVLLTGHTGFKGSWLSLWLQKLGAVVAGYSLPPSSDENLFEIASVHEGMESTFDDILNLDKLQNSIHRFHPDIVFHLAAQALVRESYLQPLETFQVNVMGTAHLLEAVRASESCRVAVIVTSDKCYENREWVWGYRECDPMGGLDPYSSSKGCAEIVTAAYRNSFFKTSSASQVAIATARAGNVIGGGDFSKDRLVPDLMLAIRRRASLRIRSPDATRPWQHVLEPLGGYLLLAEKLWNHPELYSQGWNFGPALEDTRSVRWVVEKVHDLWDDDFSWEVDTTTKPHEAHSLALDSSKARTELGWNPRWRLENALEQVVSWYKAYEQGERSREMVTRQIASYEAEANKESKRPRGAQDDLGYLDNAFPESIGMREVLGSVEPQRPAI